MGDFTTDKGQQFLRLLPHQSNIAAAFHIQSNQRLGIGRTQVETLRVEFDGQAIGKIHRTAAGFIRLPCPLNGRLRIGYAAIDLATGGKLRDALAHQR